MYDGDTFFSLTPPARIGLVLLSGALAMLTAGLFIRLVWRLAWPVRLLLAPVSLGVFVWLSPQVYYLYYIMVFDHLPLQIVVRSPPGPGDVLRLLGFAGKATLSRHALGVLGWALIALACLGGRAVRSARLRALLRL